MTVQGTSDQQQRTGTRRQTMEQKRARQAWDTIKFIKQVSEKRVRERKENNDRLQKEYRTRVSQLNTMIQVNGLGPTLGFLKSKKAQGKDKNGDALPNAYDYLLYHLTCWTSGLFAVPDPGLATPNAVPPEYDGLLAWITDTADSSHYRRATTECLAFGLWLRRFAEAELKAESAGLATPTEAAAEASASDDSGANSAGEPTAQAQPEFDASSQEGAQ